MTGVIATIPRVQFSNALGLPLAGGKLYTYLAGTTTPETTYQDQDLTAANENPIPLDSTGSCVIWLDPDKSYKFVLKSALGVTQPGWPVDNVSGASNLISLQPTLNLYVRLTALAAAAGSALIGFIQSGVDAVKRTVQDKLRDTVSVKDFDAVGDGVADDTEAINAAIAYAKSGDIKCIEFPSGNYKTTGSINIMGNFSEGFELCGHRATITATADAPVFLIDARNPESAPEVRIHVLLHGFDVLGPGKASTSSAAVQAQHGANVHVRDSTLKNCYRGLYGYGNLTSQYDNLFIEGCHYGVDLATDTEFAPNNIQFRSCQIIGNDKAIRAVGFPNGAITLDGCEIAGNNQTGTTSDGVRVVEFFNAGKVAMIGCHMEANPGQYNLYYDGLSRNTLTVIGGEIIPGDSCGNVLYMANATGLPALYVQGSRVTNNVGTSQIVLSGANPAVIVGDTSGNISGTLTNLTQIKAGKVGIGGVFPSFAGIRSKSSAGIGYDCEGMLRFIDSSETRLGFITATAIRLDANSQYSIGANNAADLLFRRLGTTTIEPGGDNTYGLGSASFRWSTVYAATATINTSDERAKVLRVPDEREMKPVGAIEDAVLRAWAKVEYYQYKFLDAVEAKGDGARWHFGLIAQRIKEAFESEGIDAFAYGLLCYDKWEDSYTDVLDENGQPTGEKELQVAAGDRYGVRYEEALALECAYLRSRLSA